MSTPVKVFLAIVAVIIIIAAVGRTWDRLTSWPPWSTESQLERSEQDRQLAEDALVVDGVEEEAQKEIYQRERETIIRQQTTIREVAAAVERARAAPDERSSSDAFYVGVCKQLDYANDPSCVQEGNTGSR